MFAREGSFVPLWISKDTIKSTESYNSKEVTIRYYPSAYASTYVWFDDDGSSTGTLERANYEVVTFKGITSGNKVTIDITTNNPNQYGKKFKRKFNIEFPVALVPGQTNAGKQTDPYQKVTNEFVTVEFNGKPLKVEVNLK